MSNNKLMQLLLYINKWKYYYIFIGSVNCYSVIFSFFFFHSPSPNLCNLVMCQVKINKMAMFTLSALKGQLKNAHGKLIH